MILISDNWGILYEKPSPNFTQYRNNLGWGYTKKVYHFWYVDEIGIVFADVKNNS